MASFQMKLQYNYTLSTSETTGMCQAQMILLKSFLLQNTMKHTDRKYSFFVVSLFQCLAPKNAEDTVGNAVGKVRQRKSCYCCCTEPKWLHNVPRFLNFRT